MPHSPQSVPKPMAVGLCLALLTVLFGFALGGTFGLAEDALKTHLKDAGNAVLESAYQGDVAAKDAVVAKSWEYFKRAHLHGGGIGAAATASIVALLLLCRAGAVAQLSALAFGLGGLIYSSYWLWAGLIAPGMGGTGAAKEALFWFATPGAALCIFGLCGTIYCVARDCLFRSQE